MLELIDLRAILIIALIFVPLERIFPLHADQAIFRRHWANDIIYLIFNGIVVKLGLLVVVAGLVAFLEISVPAALGEAVRSQPVWLQTIEVVVLADIGFYSAHRAFHAVPFLWKFHAVHHSIEEMDWLAAHRVHPVDQILTKACSYLPVFALGFSPAAVAAFAVLYHWQSLLIHSNTRLGFGPLKWILASPQFHHWHHANEPTAYNKNFAGQIPLIDAIGGTLFLPASMPARYGTEEPVPPLYHQQLAYPLQRAVRTAGAAPQLANSSQGEKS